MSKFRKHTVEKMRRRSKMRKQRKKYKRNSVKVIGHSSSTDTPEEVSEGTANFKRECVSKEEGSINYIEEDKSTVLSTAILINELGTIA